ncbi:hypothetical protein KKF61_08755 [Patescibacteria group bacterium]|nr:hypothetical protein [Patescibacteria group bacterium]
MNQEETYRQEWRKNLYRRIGYEPTPSQWEILNCDIKQLLVAGGWRGGKSTIGGHKATEFCIRPWKLPTLGWIVGPTYDIPRNSEFWYMVQDLMALQLVTSKDVSMPKSGGPCRVDIKGGITVVTKSATDPSSLGMVSPDFIIVCEAAQLDFETYLWLLGRCTEKDAPLVMTGTFEDYSGWYNDFFNKWAVYNTDGGRSFSLPTWSNTKIYPGGRDDPKIKFVESQNPADFFTQRYGGVPCKPSNIMVPEFNMSTHVGKFPFDPQLEVEITVDPGYASTHAVLAIQKTASDLRIIDEIYLQGYTTEQIIDVCFTKPWWSNTRRGTIDVAARQHQAMEAPLELWASKAHLSLRCEKVREEEGIQTMRSIFLVVAPNFKPRILINYICHGIISELGGCKSPVPNGGPWLRDKNTLKPEKQNNHALKALIYYVVLDRGYVAVREDYKRPPSMLVTRRSGNIW